MPRVLGRVVAPLTGRVSSSVSVASSTGKNYDFLVGGIPFLSAASPENPIVRRTAQIRKAQTDIGAEPGEQSLDGWWLRSQSTFHEGAGILYQEPLTGDPSSRYRDSLGVDVWTPGRVSLLKRGWEL